MVWHVIVDLSTLKETSLSSLICISKTATSRVHADFCGGGRPANWHGEPTWAAGTDVVVEGSVTDSDGIALLSLNYRRGHRDCGVVGRVDGV